MASLTAMETKLLRVQLSGILKGQSRIDWYIYFFFKLLLLLKKQLMSHMPHELSSAVLQSITIQNLIYPAPSLSLPNKKPHCCCLNLRLAL